MLQVIATSTGVQPIVAGKPEPPLHAEAVARTGAKKPLVVGDRLDTDIEGAVRGDADSMLVLTGVSTPRELVLASPSQRPTYVSSDLRGLLEPQPVVGVRRGSDPVGIGKAVRCQGWIARRETPDGQIELTGDGEPIDGLRALCALAWSGPQVTADLVDPALKVLKDRL
jgi:glycerol-1-phosphatase